MEKILQITSGRGPAECCLLVAQILKTIMQEAKALGLNVEVIEREKGPENRTLYSACIQVSGKDIQCFTKSWVGTIQWIAQSPYRKFHKRKNWFVGVNELNLYDEILHIEDKDIVYQSIRSGGPGGQHVNKVSTAIRATHLPSRRSVLASDSRSQIQNKKMAKERLIQLLKLEQLNQKKESIKTNWQNHSELERGNPVKVFKGSQFKLQKQK